MSKRKAPRQIKKTVLVVGEGEAEALFLRHLRAMYARASGVAFTIKNAYGKGALNVVNVAIAQSRNAEYDCKVVLLDTDADWNDVTASRARKAHVQVIKSEPCFEAVLLAILGHKPNATTSKAWKEALRKFTECEAHDLQLYQRRMTRDVLNRGRQGVSALNELIELFEAGVIR